MAAKHESDTLSTGYCEYLTKVKPSSKVMAVRLLIILATVVLVTAMLVITLKTIPVVSFFFGAFMVFVAWFAFQFTKIEYEYTIATGEFTLSKIYGARMRKDILNIKTSDIEAIVPESELKSIKADKVFYTCRKSDVNLLGLVYSEKEGGKNVLVISAPDKTVSCLKYYRRSAFNAR